MFRPAKAFSIVQQLSHNHQTFLKCFLNSLVIKCFHASLFLILKPLPSSSKAFRNFWNFLNKTFSIFWRFSSDCGFVNKWMFEASTYLFYLRWNYFHKTKISLKKSSFRCNFADILLPNKMYLVSSSEKDSKRACNEIPRNSKKFCERKLDIASQFRWCLQLQLIWFPSKRKWQWKLISSLFDKRVIVTQKMKRFAFARFIETQTDIAEVCSFCFPRFIVAVFSSSSQESKTSWAQLLRKALSFVSLGTKQTPSQR